MSLTPTHLGAESIGATDQNPSAFVAYTIPIVVPTDGWLIAIEAAIRSSTGNIGAALYADDGGQPGQLIALHGHSSQSYALSTADRWVTFPIFQWVAAGTYHIGAVSRGGLGSTQIRSTTGGASGDGHTVTIGTSSVIPDGDDTAATVAATTTIYSVRALFVAEDEGGEPTEISGVTRTATRTATTVDTTVTVAPATHTDTRTALTAGTTVALTLRSATQTRTRLHTADVTELSLRSTTATRTDAHISTAVTPELRSATATRTQLAVGTPATLVELVSRTATRTALRIQVEPSADITLDVGRPRSDWSVSRLHSGWSAGRPYT